ncbi:cyclic pyranopterin phosphate synthase [Actinomyces ruminicola]|uniref:Cyclic pyranopterin phosphate synthase n=1 Tax=Actinomyces ruminicola TaxID=332524 RepID=A0A1G9W8N0_9ACTO|nr:cyclic pyranopterin phosphate synthase [Actinomyces ruminicola]
MRLFRRKADPTGMAMPTSSPEGTLPAATSAPAETAASGPVRLPHLDGSGAAHMVDVSAKQPTVRTATATAFVSCSPAIIAALRGDAVPKGDALAVARIAGIAAAKRVPELLPLAHVIGVHACNVKLSIHDDGVRIETLVRTADRTGVEMEALTAATVAGLALVDMVKGVDRGVALHEAKVTSKSGGRSGHWVRPSEDSDAGDAGRASA